MKLQRLTKKSAQPVYSKRSLWRLLAILLKTVNLIEASPITCTLLYLSKKISLNTLERFRLATDTARWTLKLCMAMPKWIGLS